MLNIITSNLIYVLLVFISIDIITGFTKSLKYHTLKSAICRNGGYKKILTIFIVLISKILDKVFFNTDILYTSITTYFIINECISIFENFQEIGIKIPKKLEKIVNSLKNDDED